VTPEHTRNKGEGRKRESSAFPTAREEARNRKNFPEKQEVAYKRGCQQVDARRLLAMDMRSSGARL